MRGMKRNVSVVHLIVATRSSGPPGSGKIIKEMPGLVAIGTPYIFVSCCNFIMLLSQYTIKPLYFVSSKLLFFAVFSLTCMRISDVGM